MIERLNNSVAKKISNADTDIKDMKSVQPIKGDSWVPYRYSGSVAIPDGGIMYIIFTQDNLLHKAVVHNDIALDMTPYAVGWRSQNGVHCFPAYNYSGSGVKNQNFVLFSTQTGTVTTSATPPF